MSAVDYIGSTICGFLDFAQMIPVSCYICDIHYVGEITYCNLLFYTISVK